MNQTITLAKFQEATNNNKKCFNLELEFVQLLTKMPLNPWLVENMEAFSFYCCPECVFRSKDASFFQLHALQVSSE